MMKKFLIHMHTDAYSNSEALEKQEFALALAAFAQPVALLFSGAGVQQLMDLPCPNNCKQFAKAYDALDLFEINDVYVHRPSAQQYGAIDRISIAVEYVDDINSILPNYEVII